MQFSFTSFNFSLKDNNIRSASQVQASYFTALKREIDQTKFHNYHVQNLYVSSETLAREELANNDTSNAMHAQRKNFRVRRFESGFSPLEIKKVRGDENAACNNGRADHLSA